ncbi:MAG: hypothetical protein Kow00127_23250 [Bacteroidales bacterium]
MNKKEILHLQSVRESFHEVEALIEKVCDEYNLNETYLGCISVAISEAFDNALTHGNRNNPELSIVVSAEKTDQGLVFTVKDEGKGYDYNSIPDPGKKGSEPLHFPGRGLFLIKTLSDNVSFNEAGNEISIGFRLTRINLETEVDRISKLQEFAKPEEN